MKLICQGNLSAGQFKTELVFLNRFLVGRYSLINAARSGVLPSMTVQEFKKRKSYISKEGIRFLIGVKQHKTKSQGKAMLSINEEDEKLFLFYYRHARSLIKGFSDAKYFLLSSNATMLNGSKLINEYQKIYHPEEEKTVTAGIGKFIMIYFLFNKIIDYIYKPCFAY